MKFEIKNRYTGAIQLTIKGESFALALTAAVKAGANLRSADLRSADLRSADLRSANLYGADLYGANLYGANLYGANLGSANLGSANLGSANLGSADLRSANLGSADLYGADLRSADLYGADLYGADLYGANLLCFGDMKHIKTLQIDTWQIAYTKTTMQIGCQRHTIKAWFKFTNKQISAMNPSASKFWKTFKPILKKLIKESPAK